MTYNIVNPTIPFRSQARNETETGHKSGEKTGDDRVEEERTERDPKFEKSLISGIISLVLLSIISTSREPLYGYLIWKKMETRENGNVTLKQGTIYPVLRMLQKEGLLESKIRASDSGPARRYYWITAKGEATLKIWKESWYSARDFVEKILGGETNE
ncbi:MAG: PadR family transcriptional regulator [Theionarchaea archaeon]|nr:PadR family transcriptional regulator [Theionarchaea archaeon]